MQPKISIAESLRKNNNDEDLAKILLHSNYSKSNSLESYSLNHKKKHDYQNYENLDMFINNKRGIFDTATYSQSSSISKSDYTGGKYATLLIMI